MDEGTGGGKDDMDGWMDGQADEWMEGLTDEWINSYNPYHWFQVSKLWTNDVFNDIFKLYLRNKEKILKICG